VSDVSHRVIVAAAAETVRALIADTSRWPVIFRPTIHVEQVDQVERSAGTERIRIWAAAADEVKSWTSRREHSADGRRITFEQEVSQAPIAAMSGAWVLRELPDGRTEVVLEHSYRAVDDDPAALAWIADVTDRNSRTELANLKELAETADERDGLELTFEDTVLVQGDAQQVYDFLHRAADWPDRLPHVSRMQLAEPEPNVQVMTMDTVAPNGSTHTTKSVRVCFPGDRIVYKQVVVPVLMRAHTGEWRVRQTPDGVAVTSQHTVVIQPNAIESVLGEGATVADALAFARNALSTNSGITLSLAKKFAEEQQQPALAGA
jgi:aromatase